MSFREFFGLAQEAPHQRIRREQKRRMAGEAELNGREHIHTAEQVADFLSEPRPGVKPWLSRGLNQCPSKKTTISNLLEQRIELIEPLLLDALEDAKHKEKEKPKKIVDNLRGYVRAASWFSHARPKDDELREIGKKALREAMRKRLSQLDADQAKLSRDSLEDDAENLDEEQKELALVVDTLEENSTGQDVLPAVEAIEALVSQAWSRLQAAETVAYPKKNLAKHPHVQGKRVHLEELQRLRDALYFSYLYPINAKRNREF